MLAIFRKPYPILLGFSEDELYLISRFYNISLGFPKDIKPCKTLWTLSSCPDKYDICRLLLKARTMLNRFVIYLQVLNTMSTWYSEQ